MRIILATIDTVVGLAILYASLVQTMPRPARHVAVALAILLILNSWLLAASP